MKFTRTVGCTDEHASGTPEVMVVEIDAALAKRIRELAAEVERLDVYAIEILDSTPTWYEPDWDREEETIDGVPVPGEEVTDLDCETLKVRNDDFWWEVSLQGTSVTMISASIFISELPEWSDYDWVTHEMFDAKLRELVFNHGTAWLLSIPGVYEIVSEWLNNDVLEALEEENP